MLRYRLEFSESNWEPNDEITMGAGHISIKGTHANGLRMEICGKGELGKDGSGQCNGEFEEPPDVYVDPPSPPVGGP